MRQEPRAAQWFCSSGHLTNRGRALVRWLKTRSASRRMACPIGGRLSPDFRARRRALAIDECSDEDDQRLTIRNSRGQSQCVEMVFVTRFPEDLR
jgi:hypothetical protein